MSNFLATITDLPETTIADACYVLIQDTGTLPLDEEVFELIRTSTNLKEAGRKINRLFLEYLENALLTAVNIHFRDKVSALLSTNIIWGEEEDTFTVTFGNTVLNNPGTEELNVLYEQLVQMNKTFLTGIVRVPLMFSIDVSPIVIKGIKNVVEEGILEPIVDSSCGLTTTIIIHMGFIADMANSNSEFRDWHEHIWLLLEEYSPDLEKLRSEEPDFIELTASNDKDESNQ